MFLKEGQFKMSHRKNILYHLNILDPALDDSTPKEDFD